MLHQIPLLAPLTSSSRRYSSVCSPHDATIPSVFFAQEPGGQLELSGAPLESLHSTCAEVNSHLYQVKSLSKEMGIGFLGLGFDPRVGSPADFPHCATGLEQVLLDLLTAPTPILATH